MIRILIIDDNLIIRHMLKMHIELASDLKVVGADEINRPSIDLALKYRPDVVIVDFDRFSPPGKQVVEGLHQAVPEIPVIATSLSNNEINAADAKAAGAIDFVAKQADSVDLVNAIRKAVGDSGLATN
jgi:DNA-binding NarL/FixJ family response regulator